MPTNHYVNEIKDQEPLTKELIWSQIQHDYKFNDITRIKEDPGLKEALGILAAQLIKNRVSAVPLPTRFITEFNLRKRIGDLLGMESFEKYVDKMEGNNVI